MVSCHISPDIFNVGCSESIKDNVILLSSDINDISSVAKGRSGRAQAQMLAVLCHLACKRSRYFNRTVYYSNKAVSKPGNALPTYLV